MATSPASSSRSLVKIFVFGFIVVLVLIIAVSLLAKALSNKPKTVLTAGTFESQVEPRTATRPDGSVYTYYVLNTYNRSRDNYFSCQIDLSAKGTRDVYWGFTTSYRESDCRSIKEIQPHYECRLNNWINRAFKQDSARTIERISASGAYEIPLDRFYQGNFDVTPQTKIPEAFTTNHRLDEIFSVDVNCKNSAGNPVTHTQVL